MTKRQKKKDEIVEEILPKDYIGREKFVQNMTEIIKSANKERSWTFAINGAWGIGKSFVLNMLERKLKAEDDMLVIKYDAWKNDFYQDPLIAILHNVLDQIEKSSIGKAILDGIKNGIEAFCEILKSISLIETIDEKSKKAYKKLTQDRKLTNKLKIAENFVSFNDALDLVKEELRKITKKQKLIILVDELDRCEPDYSLTVLNRLHNLFDVPNVVVIVAVNKQQLENIIKSKYNTDKYLEKFFDLNFNLPVKETGDIRISCANKFLSNFLSDAQLEQAELFRVILTTYLSSNPREVMKFFETLNFIIKDLEDINKKYAYICFYSYILLKKDLHTNLYTSFGQNDNTPFNDYNFFINEISNDNLNKYFSNNLLMYLKENRTDILGKRVGLRHYRDETINLFLGLIMLTCFINDGNILNSIKTYYGVQFTEDDIDEIKETIALIKLLNKGQI